MTDKIKWKNTGGPLTMADGRKIKRNEVFEATEAEVPKGFRDTIKPLDSLPKVAPRKWKHRRYPDGENLIYQNAFESGVHTSPILSASNNRDLLDPTTWQMQASKRSLEGLLAEWEEKAARTVDLLGKIDAEFQNQKIRARRQGEAEPETLSPALLEEKHKAEARADVTATEIDAIREILAKRAAKEKAVEDSQVLTHGPVGSGRTAGGVLCEIDGQAVKADAEGVLILDCPRSPYHGLPVHVYKEKIVKPFQAWQRRPLSPEELALAGPDRPLRGGTIAWENLPARPVEV